MQEDRPTPGAGCVEITAETDLGALRDHLSRCPACRAAAAAIDPTVIFLALRDEPLPGSFWTAFDARLRERLAAERLRPVGPLHEALRWLGRLPRVAWVAPAATAVLLGVILYVADPGQGWRFRPARPGRPPSSLPDPYRAPTGAPIAPGRLPVGPDGGAATGGGMAGGQLLVPGMGASAPSMESVASPGARVYRFEVGRSGDETPVYIVVDESIDI